jgi:hypothetical protein
VLEPEVVDPKSGDEAWPRSLSRILLKKLMGCFRSG